MKTLANVLLWFGAILMCVSVGSFIAIHRVGGNAMVARSNAIAECKAKQAIVAAVDRTNWTNSQNASLDNICEIGQLTEHFMEAGPPGALTAIVIVSGTFLYFFALIRDAWRPKGKS